MNPDHAKDVIQSAGNRHTTFLGSRTSILGRDEDITLRDADRLTHVLTVGPTGYGKSQELLHVALQDAHKDRGLCIINPKGDLIDEFLAKLPEDRWDDVIYINPGRDSVPSINVLRPYTNGRMTQAQKENQKEIIVADLIDLFRRQSENWGDQFGRVLETLLHAYLDLNIRTGATYTLVDVYRGVINQDRLTDLIDKTRNPIIREQLVRVKEDMTSYELEPLQRRLNDFMMNAAVRRVVDAESGLDFQRAMEDRKLILVDVQKGEVGKTVSELVGSLVLTKLWAAAQSRVTQPADEREPFFLFVDELQNFAGEGSNFVKILSEAREYRLGCWVATQYLHQLPAEMRRSVTNNCRTKVVFNPSGSDDANRIAGMLQGVTKHQLKQLGKYRAAVQKPGEGHQNSAIFFSTYPPWTADRGHVEQLKQEQSPGTESSALTGITPSLGRGANSGGDTHRELLTTAKDRLEERGFQVDLLYQDMGDEKPDGHVHLPDGSIAHLEAEHATLSKPAKILQNLHRAVLHGRECIFVVEDGNAEKLQGIVSDPVNRNGTQHEDEKGSYSHYRIDGEPFDAVDELQNADYRILEVTGDELTVHEPDGSDPTKRKPAAADELREKDKRVLTWIGNGNDDVQKITAATTLENHEVTYCFEQLEACGLITVEKPADPVERVIDSQKRVFTVKTATLTETGREYLDHL